MASMKCFSQNYVLKSVGSTSQTIFTRLEILQFFVIRLSRKIHTGFLISQQLSDLWPVFQHLFFCKKCELRIQTYKSNKYSIISFYSKSNCSCAARRGAPQVQRLFSRHCI